MTHKIDHFAVGTSSLAAGVAALGANPGRYCSGRQQTYIDEHA